MNSICSVICCNIFLVEVNRAVCTWKMGADCAQPMYWPGRKSWSSQLCSSVRPSVRPVSNNPENLDWTWAYFQNPFSKYKWESHDNWSNKWHERQTLLILGKQTAFKASAELVIAATSKELNSLLLLFQPVSSNPVFLPRLQSCANGSTRWVSALIRDWIGCSP